MLHDVVENQTLLVPGSWSRSVILFGGFFAYASIDDDTLIDWIKVPAIRVGRTRRDLGGNLGSIYVCSE